MACPDGASYSASAFGLLECENAFSILPGTATSGGDTSVSLSLLGGAEGSVPIFICQSAQYAIGVMVSGGNTVAVGFTR